MTYIVTIRYPGAEPREWRARTLAQATEWARRLAVELPPTCGPDDFGGPFVAIERPAKTTRRDGAAMALGLGRLRERLATYRSRADVPGGAVEPENVVCANCRRPLAGENVAYELGWSDEPRVRAIHAACPR
jgi:hypothetical protein